MAARRTLTEALASQSLRAGTLRVTVGLAFFGGTTYIFLAVAARVLGPVGYADFAVFWAIVYGVGLGAFLPFEQEVSRRVSESRANNRTGDAVLRTAYRIGAGVALALAALMAIVVPLVNSGDTEQSLALWTASVAAFLGIGAAYVSRGGLSGNRRFGAYAAQLGLEGAGRLVAAAALAIAVVRSPWPWAFAVAASIAVSVLITARSPWRHGDQDEVVPVRAMVTSLIPIVISSTIAQLLVNFGPVVVRLLSGGPEQDLAGRFLAAALIARLPIFFFAAVQAALMPALVEAVMRRDRASFVTSIRKVLLPTIGLGVLGVLACAAAGPQMLRIALGQGFELPRQDIVLLAVAMGLFLGTLVLQPAAISLRKHWDAARTWVCAGCLFGLACLLPLGPLRTVELAMILACAAAVTGLALVVRRGLSALDTRD